MCTNDKFVGMTYLSRWFLIKDVLQGCRTTNALKALLMKYHPDQAAGSRKMVSRHTKRIAKVTMDPEVKRMV